MKEPNQASKPPYYPAFLDVCGLRCVVVGGGRVATRKVRALVDAGAAVRVVSPRVCPELEALAAEAGVELRATAFGPAEVEGAVLAFAATDDAAVNEAVAREALARGVLVNVVDQPELSTFIVPAVLSRGKLQVAISTGGASPAFARRLRERLEGILSPRLAAYMDTMAEVRALVIEQVAGQRERARIFEALASDDSFKSYLEAGQENADAMLMEKTRELIARAGAAQ